MVPWPMLADGFKGREYRKGFIPFSGAPGCCLPLISSSLAFAEVAAIAAIAATQAVCSALVLGQGLHAPFAPSERTARCPHRRQSLR